MMQEGLLWYDDDPARTVADKVSRAALRYEQKYGHAPEVCYVNTAQMQEQRELMVGLIKVMPAPIVRPHHFWLGTESERAAARTRTAQPRPEPAAGARRKK